jgi:general receptor for phosphoinositides 1-associated scaffold protein
MDPHQKYFIKTSTPNSSGEYLVSNASSSLPRSHNNFTISSNENNSYSSLSNQQSPSQRSQVLHHHHHHIPDGNSGGGEYISNHQHATEHQKEKTSKSRRHHGHGHSCNPCIGHFISKRDKSAEKDNKDNVSIDAYDLASPCCDPNCVPVKRRSRHHKEHHHKHKHRDKDKERPPRPRSQSHASPQMQTAHVHYDTSGKHVSLQSIDVVSFVIKLLSPFRITVPTITTI